MMKQLSCVLFALGMSVGCTVNGKPMFGFGSTTPPAGPKPVAAQPATAAAPTNATPATVTTTGSKPADAPSTPAAPAAPAPVADSGTLKIEDVKAPAATDPIQGWTAVQQWMPKGWGGAEPRSTYGYGTRAGAVVLADELGPKLSQLGRASLLAECFTNEKEDATAAIAWAVCGKDARAFDLKQAEAELVKGGIKSESRADVLATAKAAHDKATKIGAAVEAAAKDDPGLAALLKVADTAREEWSTFASKHQASIDRYLALKDAVRSGKSNHKGFTGCFEATQAPFAKVVKAAKFPWEEEGDPMPFYVSYLVKTPEGYLATVAYAACAWSHHANLEGMYAAAANQKGGELRAGQRSLVLAKLMDPALKPKFADRSISIDSMRSPWERGVQLSGINWVTAIQTPGGGKLSSVKKDGDVAKLNFSADKVEACLQWRDTNRIQSVSGGSVTYQKECVKRGKVENQEGEIEVPVKYVGGLAPGVNVITVGATPVVGWKDGKLKAVLGIAL